MARPRINRQVAEFIILAVNQHPDWSAPDIEKTARNKFEGKGIPVPKLRTIQQYASTIREKLKQEKPWSLAAMAQENEIPWEAAPFLLHCADELIRLTKSPELPESQYLHREDFTTYIKKHGIEVKMPPPQRLTYREAKWLWRIHLIAPKLRLIDIWWFAQAYTWNEMSDDYLGFEFDTSDLDGGLMNLIWDIKRKEGVSHNES